MLSKVPGFRTKTRWKMVVAAVGYAFIALSVIIAATSPNSSPSTSPRTSTPAPARAAAKTSSTATAKPSLGVSRADFMSMMTPQGFTFTQGASTANGEANWDAKKGLDVCQLIGPADNLREASLLFVESSNASQTDTTVKNLTAFLAMGVTDHSDDVMSWVTNEITKNAVGPASKVFGNVEVTYRYTPSISTAAVTLDPAQ